MMADQAASVIAHLKKQAQERGVQLQLLLNLFCQEEFLRRISNSVYSDQLILKGGLLLYSLSRFESRPTMDADYLLRRHDNDVGKIVNMVQRIIDVPYKNEFIRFTIRNSERISEHRKYNGVRINLILLSDFDLPEVLTYSLESTIAEKFDAILSRMELTSRMKDFFDIYYLATTYHFEGRKLQEAIQQTLENRRTEYTSNSLNRISQFVTNRDMPHHT
jgi:predicted nucleotidyltransferase component of viral defense system